MIASRSIMNPTAQWILPLLVVFAFPVSAFSPVQTLQEKASEQMRENSERQIHYRDVAYGVAGSLVVFVIFKIYSFLHIRPCCKIQEKALSPIAPLGDDETITVWGFQEEGNYPKFNAGIVDGSPYVARVEVYLRLLGLDYTKKMSADLAENPRGKLPFANVYGRMVDDSSKIIDAIDESRNRDPLDNLNQQQLVQAHLIRRLLTGSFYWVRFSMNFGTEIGRQAVIEETAKTVPGPILPFVAALIINSQQANLDGQGTGRLPLREVIAQGEADLRVLNAILCDSKTKFILGTKEATVVDTDVYAFVSHLFYDTTPSEMDWVVEIKEELPKLVQYIDRMRDLIFPELSGGTRKIKAS